MPFKKKLILVLFALILIVPQASQADERGFNFGLFGGGGIGRVGGFQTNHDDYRFINAMVFVGYQFSSRVGARLSVGLDRYINVQSIFDFLNLNNQAERNDSVGGAELAVLFHIGDVEAFVSPYVLVGVRVLGINPAAGFGLKLSLTSKVSAFAEGVASSVVLDSKIEGRIGIKFQL